MKERGERERELKQSVNQWHGLNIKEYRMTRDIFMTNESWECSRVAKSRNSFREKIAEKRINRKILYFWSLLSFFTISFYYRIYTE